MISDCARHALSHAVTSKYAIGNPRLLLKRRGITEKAQDPLKVAKSVYKFIMENDRARVLEVLFRLGDKAVMHYHPDHVVYVLKGGKAKMTSSGKTDLLELRTGQAIFLKAQSHEAENEGKTDLDLLVVELRK